MRDGEPQVYTSLVTMRNTYMQLQWNRVQIFLVFNAFALPLTFSALAAERTEVLRLIVTIFGFLLHVLLLIARERADRWIRFLDKRLVELEKLDPKEARDFLRVPVFSHWKYVTLRHSAITTRGLFGIFGAIMTLFWFEEVLRHT